MIAKLLLFAVLSQAPDAPIAPRPAIVVKSGDAVPFDGVCLDTAQAVAQANKLQAAESKVRPEVVVLVAVAAVLLGGAVGFGVSRTVK